MRDSNIEAILCPGLGIFYPGDVELSLASLKVAARYVRAIEGDTKIPLPSAEIFRKNRFSFGEANLGTGDASCIGGIAQLGEHLLCKQGVKGSIPFIST